MKNKQKTDRKNEKTKHNSNNHNNNNHNQEQDILSRISYFIYLP